MKHRAKQLLTSFEHKVTASDSRPQRSPGKRADNPITSNLNWPLEKYVNLTLLFDFLPQKKKKVPQAKNVHNATGNRNPHDIYADGDSLRATV